MSTYSGSSNWSFINISQSDGSPSYVRGTPIVSDAGLLNSRNITNAFTSISSGAHAGSPPSEMFSYSNPPTQSLPVNQAAGSHAHGISGFSSTSSVGGKYHTAAVVGLYKCTTSTKVLPKGSLIFAKYIQNSDFVEIDKFNSSYFDGVSLLSGSSTWVTANATTNYGIYGENISSFTVPTPTVSTAGIHNHYALINNYKSGLGTYFSTYYIRNDSVGDHTHTIDVTASADPKIKYFKAYKAIRDTGVYYGMILGWTGKSSASLPTGWYICDGRTINGVVLPVMNEDYCIAMTSFDVFDGYKEGTDTMSISVSAKTTSPLSHDHGAPDPLNNGFYNGVQPNYHRSYAWYHSHDGPSISLPYKQGYYTLNFIIYLG
jgi:hypothetical protein